MSEFYAPPVRDLGDPATDPPLTVRACDGQDRHTRLFDRDALRAVKTTDDHWLIVAGDTEDIGEWRDDYEVRTWPVVPAYAVSAPWTRAAQAEPAPAAHERGDMDVEAFRGEVAT